MCLFMPQLFLVFTATTHEGMAKLSWLGYILRWFIHLQILTNL